MRDEHRVRRISHHLTSPNVTFAAYGPVCVGNPAFALFGGSPAEHLHHRRCAGGHLRPRRLWHGHLCRNLYLHRSRHRLYEIDQPEPDGLPVAGGNPEPHRRGVCKHPAIRPYRGRPSGEHTSGPGVIGGIFNPAAAGPGDNIVYTYTRTAIPAPTAIRWSLPSILSPHRCWPLLRLSVRMFRPSP